MHKRENHVGEIRLTMQTDNHSVVALNKEAASCRYTGLWYVQWSLMVQNHGHTQWRRKHH